MSRSLLPRLIGIVLLGMGVVIMLGWLLRLPQVLQFVPGFVMVFNTALGFVIAGLALMAYDIAGSWRKQAQSALGAILVVLAASVLAQHAFEIEPGLDWPNLHYWLPGSNAHPGRMAIMTCAAFFMAGMVLILQHRVTNNALMHAVRFATAAIAAISLMSIAGQILGLHFMFKNYLYAQLALPTAGGLLLLSVGLWGGWSTQPWNVPQLFKTDVSRIVLASGGILIVTAALCGLAGFIVMQYGAEETLGDGLARILNLRVAAMKQIIIRHTESANRFAAKPEIMQQLATIASKPTDGSLRLPLQALADKALTAGYSAVTFTNAGGAVIAAAGQEMMTADITMPLRLPNAASLSWSEQFLLITETAVSDNGKPLGSVTLQRPLPEIEKLLMDITETGETGELLICTLRNTSIACAPTRLRPRPLKVPLASGSTRGPIRLALQGRAGVTKYTDLRGKEAIAAYAPLGDLGPAMALRIDTTVLYEPILNKLTYLVPFVAVLLAAGIALQRAIVTPLAHKLARSEQRLQLALDGSRLALWDWDVSNGKVYLGEQWQVILGGQAGPSVITSAELQSMVHPEDLPTLATQLRDVLKGKLDLYDVEHRVRTLSDEWKWIHSKGKVVARSGDGRVSRMIGTNADIDEHKQAELLVEHQAKHDMLTSLPNRVLFYDRLKRATARSKRYQRLMAVLYLDIDKFKSINDNLGHAMGDALLKGFARRLADCVRQTDTVARLGGDEFTVILEELNNRDNGRAVAQKIVESMRPEFLLENRAITITTSAGMVFFEGAEDVSGDALIKKADQALYEAKGAGRNNYHEAA